MIKILVVDNDGELNRNIKLNLEETHQYEVKTVTNGQDALEIACDFHPDLILLDIMLPGMPGDQIAAQLKERKETENIPVIFITGLAGKGNGKLHYNGNVPENILTKPFNVPTLINRIDQALAA